MTPLVDKETNIFAVFDGSEVSPANVLEDAIIAICKFGGFRAHREVVDFPPKFLEGPGVENPNANKAR